MLRLSFGVRLLFRSLNRRAGESGYADSVVNPAGRKPELVGISAVVAVLTVVEKESVSVEVLVTNTVAIWVV